MDLSELDELFGKSEGEMEIDEEEFRKAVEEIDSRPEEAEEEAWGW